MTQGGNYPFISVAHHFPLTSGGAAGASTVAWYQNASTGAVATSSALAGTPGTTTTGWVAPATAATTYLAGQVVTSMLGNSTQKWYFTQGSNESWAGHRYMKVDLLRGLPGLDVLDRYYFFVSSAADASVRHTEVEIPYFRDSGYHTLSFRIVNSSEVYTWGIMSAGVATGASTTQWSIRNPEKRNMTELETVLETNNTVLVPANYVPTGEQGRVDLLTSQTLIDLRPSIKLISNDGSRKTIGSVFIDPTGTSDALHDMAQFFLTQVPDHTDVHFPPGARYLFKQHESVFFSNLKDVRVFGNRSMFAYDSSVASTRRDVAMFHIGGFLNSPLRGVQDFELHDVALVGYPYTTTLAGGDSSRIVAVSNSGVSTDVGVTKLSSAMTTGATVRTTYWNDSRYLKHSDAAFTTDWQYRMDFRLSADNPLSSDVEISIRDDLGTIYAISTITVTAVESTYSLVADTAQQNIGYRTAGYVRKATNGASTINIHSIVRWGPNLYSATDVEVHHGIFVYANNFTTESMSTRMSRNVLINKVHTEGFRGDGIAVGQFGNGPAHVTISNSTSRANARQQISVVGGEFAILRNNRIREYVRTGMDVEALGTDKALNTVIDGNQFYMGLSAGFNAISAPSSLIVNLTVINNQQFTQTGQFLNLGANGGFVGNNHIQGYSTATGYTKSATEKSIALEADATDITITGNHFAGPVVNSGIRNVIMANRVRTSSGGATFTDKGTNNAWYWNTQVGSTAFGSGTFYGQVNISSATNPIVVGMQTIGMSQAAQTFKGVPMIGNTWHPGGMRLRQEPIRELRGISASTAKMNQLMMTVTPTANTTTMAVVFTSKPIRGVLTGSTVFSTTEAAGSSDGSTLTAVWTNTSVYYRIAAHNYYGPASAGTTFTVTLATTTSVARVRIGGLLNTSHFTNGFRLYRGEADGTTTAYYDILPLGDAKEFAAMRQDLKNFYDYGTNIFIPMDADDEWGYSTAYAVITGTSVALTSCPATDYTGAMLSTTYSVIPGAPNWNAGTVYATGKTSMGFQLSWTGTTADGTNTIPLMFASS